MNEKSLLKNVMTPLSGGAAAVLLAIGVLASPQALAGIANTKHNLGTNGGSNVSQYAGTGEICVFCHTPHGSSTGASVPLWNRTLPTASSYNTYNSLGTSSLDGATVQVGSVSLACLSCHDGTQAMDVINNEPGSGADVTAYSGKAWTGNASANGKIPASSIAMLGTDLSNDHPIGIQYAGGMPSNVAFTSGDIATTAFNDPDFAGLQGTTLNGTNVWWVDSEGGTPNARDKKDMQLYTRTAAIPFVGTLTGTPTGTALAGAQGFVECASCHDPHVEDVSGSNPTFLRISNDSSAVCLTCHVK